MMTKPILYRMLAVLAATLLTVGLLVVVKPAEAAFPGTNGKIAFERNEDFGSGFTGEIFVMNPDGTDPTRLTNNQERDLDPVFSADGRYIAFAREQDGNYEIYAMRANGAEPVRLTDNSVDDFDPGFSPDGEKIAFVSRDVTDEDPYDFEIFVMDADGTNETNLTDGQGQSGLQPAFSPNGTKIAFASTRDGDHEIWVMD